MKKNSEALVGPKSKKSSKNWWRRINAAKKRGEFTDEDIKDSSYWFSCACGQLNPLIPRNPIILCPLDTYLVRYGVWFTEYVGRHDFLGAENTLKLIELREKAILNGN
jgi:hypothetical protein